jgi:hypothetical protein
MSIADIFKTGPKSSNDILLDASSLADVARGISGAETTLAAQARQQQIDETTKFNALITELRAQEAFHTGEADRAAKIADRLDAVDDDLDALPPTAVVTAASANVTTAPLTPAVFSGTSSAA